MCKEEDRFQHVVEILDEAVGGPAAPVGAHGPFWRNMSKQEFVGHVLPGFDVKLLEVGHPTASNLVKAMRGVEPFDDVIYPRMPYNLPSVPERDIQYIEEWILDGCP